MRKLFYMGLEPYEGRYTLQLQQWNESVFRCNIKSQLKRPELGTLSDILCERHSGYDLLKKPDSNGLLVSFHNFCKLLNYKCSAFNYCGSVR